MPVKKGDTIRVSYTGSFPDGQIFDSTSMHDDEPLEFTVGKQQVVKGFDNAVVGKKKDEEFEITVEPDEGYGQYNEKAVQQIMRENLPADMDPQVGMILQLQHKHQDHEHQILATVKKVEDDAITIDLNHPLAGKTLNFKIKIEEIL